MTFEILLQIFFFGIALSMDAFAVSITDGLIYTDINKRRSLFISGTFGVFQGVMPLIGFFIVELVGVAVGEAAGNEAGQILSVAVCWIAFALLLFIGGKMLFDAIAQLKKSPEQKEPKSFSVGEVLYMGIATSIDALAVGVSLHADLSDKGTIWLHVSIITVCTFVISLLGVSLGKFFDKLMKGKYEISSVIGGTILILLAVWIVLSHYFGI